MIKEFCDKCGVEIKGRNFVSNGIKYDLNGFLVEITLGVNRVWNKGHLCGSCARKLVREALEETKRE